MIKYYYPKADTCYRVLHSAHAIYQAEDGRLMARAMRSGDSALYELEIAGFELPETGVRHD